MRQIATAPVTSARITQQQVGRPDSLSEKRFLKVVRLWSSSECSMRPMRNSATILSAVRDGGKIGKVKIVCFDEDDETLKGIKEGAIYATVVQQPFEFGYQSIQMMAKILDGDRSVISPSKQIFVPTKEIKKDNVESFITELNKLRGRS